MDFSLTEEQKMLKTMVADFASKELEPIAAQIDEESRFPTESIPKMAGLGLPGVGLPEEYSGSGGGATEFCLVTEEICRVCAATGTILLASSGLTGIPIFMHGDEEQKKRFVPPVASGQVLGAFALTEAGAGSDPAAMETTATRKDKGYVLNGSKIFITNGAEAGIILVFASTDKSLRHKGISAFILEKDTPGFSVGKHENKMGIRGSSTVELAFEDCFVPEENRLGNEGDGFRIAINTIDASRVVVAAQALGIAQGAFDHALAYAKERQQFGQPIISFQAIQWMLADMATQIDASRLLIYRAAYLQDNGQPFIKEASMAKVFAAETSSFVANKAVQIFGGYGYIKEYPVERYLRDAKITEIYEGTSEMQRMTIARQLMKEG
ncbi:MAG: acyl-CoA dehydrogenase [Dehalococcoidia bacterium]|nr:acyl-CoA dehydrogenase [Dehalococcoidia bacterium]